MSAFSLRGAPVVLLAFVIVASSLGPVFAQTPVPATAAPRTGVGNWQTLTSAAQEFDFQYYGGGDPVAIQLASSPAGAVGFNVYTHQQWLDMAAGNTSVVPIGRGTANPGEPGNLNWRGGSPEAGLYHVQVSLLGSQPGSAPASFWIASSGSGAGPLVPITPVASGPATSAATATAAPTATRTATPTRVVATGQVTTTTPVKATASVTATVTVSRTAPVAVSARATVTPTATVPRAPSPMPQPAPPTHIGVGNFQPIGEQPLEFAFDYYGGNLPVQVLVGADPASGVGFNVYTDDQWRAFAAGDVSVVPLGGGTANAYEPGSLFWQGGSPERGLYHVQVFRRGPQPANFWIALQSVDTSGLTAILPAAPPAPAK